jgi:hypothetical protein
MGWIADLLKEIPSAARYKADLEQLSADHDALKKQNNALRTALDEANAKLAALSPSGGGELDPQKVKILRLLAQHDRVDPKTIAGACGMGIELAKLHLEELFESDHITNILVIGEGAYYSLDQVGRRYLLQKGLLK